jgi:hypothetical protein
MRGAVLTLVGLAAAVGAVPAQAMNWCSLTQITPRLERDCQEFRVWAGIMGKKESHYVPTQRTCDPL